VTPDLSVVDPGQGGSWGVNSQGIYDGDNLEAGIGWDTAYGVATNPTQIDHPGYSMMGAAQDMGAYKYYNNGFYGYDSTNKKSIGIALIDSGVAPVPGVSNGGPSPNLVHGPDFSFDGNTALAHTDTLGHGTMMAGLIAGRDFDSPFNPNINFEYNGVAPYAKVISLKVADTTGGVDVTQVIAAIDWAVAHRSDRNLNIRIINLSYGLDAMDDWKSDLLSYAIEQAWKAGIVVVAAAGNGGNKTSTTYVGGTGLSSPAYNQDVIAVASYDTNGTPAFDQNAVKTGLRSDDFVPPYTSGATTQYNRAPDFAAPGQHVVGLHVANSYEDTEMYRDCFNAQNSMGWTSSVFGPNDRFLRGSGTSEAAALTSGAVALMLSRNPNLRNDQIKKMLSASAKGFGGGNNQVGAGAIDLADAYNLTPPNYYQSHSTPTGGGTLVNARGMEGPLASYKDSDPTGHPTACEDYWQYVDNPKLTQTLTSTQITPINANFTSYCTRRSMANDMFGHGVPWSKLEGAEKTFSAWVKSSDGPYEYWVGDPSLTVGTGLIDDPNKQVDANGNRVLVNGQPLPVLGKVWASGGQTVPPRPWPALDSISVRSTTLPTWDTTLSRWSLRNSSWARMSLTGRDWSSYSLRDSGLH
jgi:hypothetical protein